MHISNLKPQEVNTSYQQEERPRKTVADNLFSGKSADLSTGCQIVTAEPSKGQQEESVSTDRRGSFQVVTPNRRLEITSAENVKPAKSDIDKLRQKLIDYITDRLKENIEACPQIENLINGIQDEAFSLALQLASMQDNNPDYFNELSRFNLPDGHHSHSFETQLAKYRSIPVEDQNLDLIHLAAIDYSTRLEDEFGIYYAPSSKWMTPLVEELKKRDCHQGIEVMAGNGSLSYFLNKHYGLAMVASDDHSSHPKCQRKISFRPPFEVVTEDSINTVNTHNQADFLLISWPTNYSDEEADEDHPSTYFDDYRLLTAWGTEKLVVFIGERPSDSHGSTGATGSSFFHNYLDFYFDPIEIPEYQGRHINSRDKAILFVPNGREADSIKDLIQVGALPPETINQCPIS